MDAVFLRKLLQNMFLTCLFKMILADSTLYIYIMVALSVDIHIADFLKYARFRKLLKYGHIKIT